MSVCMLRGRLSIYFLIFADTWIRYYDSLFFADKFIKNCDVHYFTLHILQTVLFKIENHEAILS